MAFTPGSSNGVSNNTTAVTIVAAPASSTQRMVRSITVFNKDTVAVVATIALVDTATIRNLYTASIDPGQSLTDDTVYVLDSTDKSLTIVLGGAVTTSQPVWTTHFADNA